MNVLIASLALAVTGVAQPTVFAPVAGADDTFTFTVPVQISNVRVPLRQAVVVCGIASGTSALLGNQFAKGQGEMFTSAPNADGSAGRILGEGHTAVPATSATYSGSLTVVVRTRASAPGMAPHSYACALLTESTLVRNRSERGFMEYDPATFRPLVSGTIQ